NKRSCQLKPVHIISCNGNCRFPVRERAFLLMETTVPFKGNWRFLQGNQRLPHMIRMLDLYELTI
ncbi:hypothetical protein, partial [Bacteroides thetaiotaomicron]